MTGLVSYHAGLTAEAQVEDLYARSGAKVVNRRWRGKSGEIDLIARRGEMVIFIEVKKARDFTRAVQSLGRRQMRRLYAAASEYLAAEPWGQDTPARFDVALVNAAGEIEIIENAALA